MNETTPSVPIGINPFKHRIPEAPKDETMGVKAFSSWVPSYTKAEENWGLNYETPQWLLDVHNKYSGRCFLMGTGPSLAKQADLMPLMEKEYLFTCNRMAQWKDLKVKPFVHCVTEPQPFLEWGNSVVPIYDHPNAQNKVGCIWWPIRATGWLWVPKAPEEIQLRWQGFQGLTDKFVAFPTGWASPLTIAQLAAWMGFREFYFLGIDTTQVGQAWNPVSGRTVFPRNIRSICESFERARIDIQLAGREVWDCTPGGRINAEGILPFKDLAEVLNG